MEVHTCILPMRGGLSVGIVLLCLAQMPRPCNRAWRGLFSLGGGTQRSPLAQLSVYTPQGSPWANNDVLPAALWSLGGRPAPSGSLHEGQTLKGPKRFAPVHDPQWAISSKTMAVKLESRDIFCLLRLSTVSLGFLSPPLLILNSNSPLVLCPPCSSRGHEGRSRD